MENKELEREVVMCSNIVNITLEPSCDDYMHDEYEHNLRYDTIKNLTYDILISLIDVIDRLEKHLHSCIEPMEAYKTSNSIVWLKRLFNNIIWSHDDMDEFEPFYVKNKFA